MSSFLLKCTGVLFILCTISPVAARHLDRRSDLDDVPLVNTTGYTVSLTGGLTCSSFGNCTSSLTAPAVDESLWLLALARGVFTYSCDEPDDTAGPTYISQSTQLWDAAPLIQKVPDEASFHAIVPLLYDYDYSQLVNSTLECLGTIGSLSGVSVFTLVDIATFETTEVDAINPPENPGQEDARWVRSISEDLAWDIYRVEVTGGAPPASCQGRNSTIELVYAAEYWFYHT